MSRKRPAEAELDRSLRVKWKAPADPFTLESGLKTLEPPTTYMIQRQTNYLAGRIHDFQLPSEEKTGYGIIKAQENYERYTESAREAYAVEFQQWLLGSSKYNVQKWPSGPSRGHLKTPWGTRPLTCFPDTVGYLSEFAVKRMKFQEAIAILYCTGPVDLNSAWLYFKYIVCGTELPSNQTEFLKDYAIYTDWYHSPAMPTHLQLANERANHMNWRQFFDDNGNNNQNLARAAAWARQHILTDSSEISPTERNEFLSVFLGKINELPLGDVSGIVANLVEMDRIYIADQDIATSAALGIIGGIGVLKSLAQDLPVGEKAAFERKIGALRADIAAQGANLNNRNRPEGARNLQDYTAYDKFLERVQLGQFRYTAGGQVEIPHAFNPVTGRMSATIDIDAINAVLNNRRPAAPLPPLPDEAPPVNPYKGIHIPKEEPLASHPMAVDTPTNDHRAHSPPQKTEVSMADAPPNDDDAFFQVGRPEQPGFLETVVNTVKRVFTGDTQVKQESAEQIREELVEEATRDYEERFKGVRQMIVKHVGDLEDNGKIPESAHYYTMHISEVTAYIDRIAQTAVDRGLHNLEGLGLMLHELIKPRARAAREEPPYEAPQEKEPDIHIPQTPYQSTQTRVNEATRRHTSPPVSRRQTPVAESIPSDGKEAEKRRSTYRSTADETSKTFLPALRKIVEASKTTNFTNESVRNLKNRILDDMDPKVVKKVVKKEIKKKTADAPVVPENMVGLVDAVTATDRLNQTHVNDSDSETQSLKNEVGKEAGKTLVTATKEELVDAVDIKQANETLAKTISKKRSGKTKSTRKTPLPAKEATELTDLHNTQQIIETQEEVVKERAPVAPEEKAVLAEIAASVPLEPRARPNDVDLEPPSSKTRGAPNRSHSIQRTLNEIQNDPMVTQYAPRGIADLEEANQEYLDASKMAPATSGNPNRSLTLAEETARYHYTALSSVMAYLDTYIIGQTEPFNSDQIGEASFYLPLASAQYLKRLYASSASSDAQTRKTVFEAINMSTSHLKGTKFAQIRDAAIVGLDKAAFGRTRVTTDLRESVTLLIRLMNQVLNY